MSTSSIALSALVLLAFLVASAAFLALAKALARDPATEAWFVALALAAVSAALLLALEDREVMLPRTPLLIHAGFAALAFVWYILRRTTQALGPPSPNAIGPVGLAAVVVVPATGALFALVALASEWVLWAPYVGLVQVSAVGVAWLIDGWRAPAAHAKTPAGAGLTRAPVGAPGAARAVAPDIFVCYRREDSRDVTGRIYDRLVARFGREHVFKDVDSIPLGVDFRSHLQRVVGRCDVFVIVIGDRWLGARAEAGRRLDDDQDFVRIEIETALQRQIPVVPVLVGGAPVPAERDLPPPLAPLAYRQGIAVRPDPDFHHDIDRLIQGIEGGNQ